MYNTDEIMESIENGQRRQALRQISESNWDFVDFLAHLEMNGKFYEVINMLRVAENSGYISYNPEKVKGF